ncbi:polynucleotide adenylyltransferase PcnB [Beggiatoa leptomitoformis]|uniref:Poly(A) polymerase I n=1 Tax=Beggiatoa leptomitoformis TaxID=288004 RepID=A0A2N9YHF2_9GAMM|nr:polynucleotide adenylyltransferase PcnB [Beggiatoa leptomitoformis]ALG67818.1 polynucleotide adenylyltransferase PcnB [Beggiatoa leptomitoformis]AUI69927.1 polynucleotide adenylyltransferase PcnB [Beggiatoa leptomitoformis]
MTPYKRLVDGIKKILKSFEPSEVQPQTALSSIIDTQKPVPLRISRAEHALSRKNISKSALKVLYQLQSAGFQAYIVGGGVRDVLLGKQPKDFDIVTNALPEQVKNVFRNCRLIGRRFVLAHVYFGQEIVEVATFRASHGGKVNGNERVIEDGRIVRDNVYGTTVDEDANRRDFTFNALYYDINDFAILDYANGMADLQAGIVRLIGDPMLRYQEDPVRMLRAVRFAAKLGFTIENYTAEPIPQLGGLLADVPSARLHDEVLKLFLSGHGLKSFRYLRQYGLFEHLFRQTHECILENPNVLTMVEQVLKNTDERVAKQQSVNPAFLFAALLWSPILKVLPFHREEGASEQDCLINAMQRVMNKQVKQVAIPKRISVIMQEIWLMQPRLLQRKNKRKRLLLMEHPRFRAAYDFLLLRAFLDAEAREGAEWWTQALTTEVVARVPEENTPVIAEIEETLIISTPPTHPAIHKQPHHNRRKRRPYRRRNDASQSES